MHEEEKLESSPGNIYPKSPSLGLIKRFILSPPTKLLFVFLQQCFQLPFPVLFCHCTAYTFLNNS